MPTTQAIRATTRTADTRPAPRAVQPAVPTLACPIGGVDLVDSVIASDGQSYDATALATHLATNHDRLPSGRRVEHRLVVLPDFHVREVARDQANGNAVDPDDLCDPISFDRFSDPVVASDGRTYDLETWLNLHRNGGASPFTRQPLGRMAYRSQAMRRLVGLPPLGDTSPVVELAGRNRAAASDRLRVPWEDTDLEFNDWWREASTGQRLVGVGRLATGAPVALGFGIALGAIGALGGSTGEGFYAGAAVGYRLGMIPGSIVGSMARGARAAGLRIRRRVQRRRAPGRDRRRL